MIGGTPANVQNAIACGMSTNEIVNPAKRSAKKNEQEYACKGSTMYDCKVFLKKDCREGSDEISDLSSPSDS